MSNNCCDSSYYRTPYNVNYQNLYCNLAQSADTNLENVITSGYSYNKQMGKKPESVSVRENYCGCGFTKVYNDAPMAEYYDKDRRRMMVMKAASEQNGGGCPTDFYRTPYNVAYQKLYSGLAERANTNLFNFREDYASAGGDINKAQVRPKTNGAGIATLNRSNGAGMQVRGPKNVEKVTYFYSR